MTYVIAQPCVDLKDRACVDECPVDCIYEGKRMLYIHPDECVDCGACEPVCPVEAIFYEDDTRRSGRTTTPPTSTSSTTSARPVAPRRLGVIDTDHPIIAALPPQNQTSEPSGGAAGSGVARSPAGSRTFPWDTIAAAKARAAHPGRHRRPVDRHPGRPDARRRAQALIAAADAPGYPTVLGPESLRQAAVDWIERRFGVTGLSPAQVLPTIGSKELIANLPMQLGLGPDDLVVIPELAYPTYEVGARYAGCRGPRRRLDVALGPDARR